MSLSEFAVRRIEKAANKFLEKRRPPPEIRDQVDVDFRIDGQSVTIFEIRAAWNGLSRKIESVIAKATYVKTTDTWKLYWHRSDLKWHSYKPNPQVNAIEDFFDIVDKDECSCFFG